MVKTMSVQFYYVMHLAGIVLVFLAYGLLVGRAMARSEDATIRTLGAIASGVGLIFILVSGFGLLGKLQYGWPLWSFIKMFIWLGLGGMIAVINRMPHLGRIWFWVIVLLGFIAVLTAYMKPGM